MTMPPAPASNTDFTGYSPALGDWRLALPLWILGAEGRTFDPPMSANQVTTLQSATINASFPTPSAAALHLNSSWKAARRAHALRRSLLADYLTPENAAPVLQFQNANCGPLFDLFEELIVCVSGAFAAVEAFCNRVIIDKAGGNLLVKRNKAKENLSPAEVVRKCSIEEKVKRIVPDLCGVPSPAGKKVYEQFVRLKGIRDSVIHFKRHDEARLAGDLQDPTALFKLFLSDQYAIPENAMSLIAYLASSNPVPRWMKNPEWVRPPADTTEGMERWATSVESLKSSHGIGKG